MSNIIINEELRKQFDLCKNYFKANPRHDNREKLTYLSDDEIFLGCLIGIYKGLFKIK